MEENLRQMTTLVMKLSEKVKRQKGNAAIGDGSKAKKKGKYYEVAEDME